MTLNKMWELFNTGWRLGVDCIRLPNWATGAQQEDMKSLGGRSQNKTSILREQSWFCSSLLIILFTSWFCLSLLIIPHVFYAKKWLRQLEALEMIFQCGSKCSLHNFFWKHPYLSLWNQKILLSFCESTGPWFPCFHIFSLEET